MTYLLKEGLGQSDAKLINLQHGETGLTALHVVAIHGFVHLVKKYLKQGADPKLCTGNGFDTRTWAAEYNRSQVTPLTPLPHMDPRSSHSWIIKRRGGAVS